MSLVKEKLIEIIKDQPEDSTPEEILRELALSQIIERGIDDLEKKRVISNEEIKNRIDKKWK
jgi:hypothetical protein